MSNQRYSLDFHNLDRPKAQLLYVTCATSDRDWHSMEHAHSFSELFFVTKGSGFFQIGSKKIPVQKNDLIFINPNTPHTELGNRENPWEYVALGIEGVQFGYAQKGTPYDYSRFSLPPGQQEIRRYLDTLLKEVQSQPLNYTAVCQNLLELILLFIARSTRQELLTAPQQKTTRECKLVEQYINEHYAEDITLEFLSSLVHINKYYLVHAFKSYKGISPINYLIGRRVEEARYLLESTNYPVTKIGEITGFSSQSYFSQTFKKFAGISPNEYRKKTARHVPDGKKATASYS